MTPKHIPMVALGWLMLQAGAQASPAACDAIVNGFNAVASVPGYRQTIDMPRSGEKLEGVIIGETMYMRVNDKWSRIRLKPGGRKGLTSQMIAMSSISDCKEVRAEALPSGARAKVYDFLMQPPRGMPGVGDKPIRQQVWIGIEDGLVHKQVGDDLLLVLSYDKVVAPIP